MANELVHTDVGSSLTEVEFDAVTAHQFNNGATGDVPYGSSASQISRRAIGATNEVLTVVGGVPAWAKAPLARQGGNTTEATTTSTSVVTILTATSLNIAATLPILIIANVRKTTGAANNCGLKCSLNGGSDLMNNYDFFTTANQAESGLLIVWIGARITNYLRAGLFWRAQPSAHIRELQADAPTAAITSVEVGGRTKDAANTLAMDEMHVYSLAAS